MSRFDSLVGIAEGTNDPSTGRISNADMLRLLERTFGELAAQQAHIIQLIEQAVPRYAIVQFAVSEVDVVGPPYIKNNAKPVPPGDWKTAGVLASPSLIGNIPAHLIMDEHVYTAINTDSPVVFPLFERYSTCALAMTSIPSVQGSYYVVFTNREMLVRS